MPSRPVTLDDLIVLNDEIASLVRCGVPLELGLVGLGSTLTGRLGRLTSRLASNLQKGATLPEALSTESKAVTAVYRAVVEAGLRSGRLADALASFGGLARSVQDLRQQIAMALFYPTITVLLGYALFVGFVTRIQPVMEEAYESMQLKATAWQAWFHPLRETVGWWGPIVPIIGVVLFVWSRLTRASVFGVSQSSSWLTKLAHLPHQIALFLAGVLDDVDTALASAEQSLFVSILFLSLRIVLWPIRLALMVPISFINLHRASFAHILRVLIEQEVPLPDALELAGDATGNSRLSRAARHLATSVRAGRSLSDALAEPVARRNLPSFLRWMLSVGGRQATLDTSLKQLAEVYRRRAIFQAEWVRIMLPVTAVIVIGGSVTLAYGLTLFVPLTQLLADLGTE